MTTTLELRPGRGGLDAELCAARLADSIRAMADRRGWQCRQTTSASRSVTLAFPAVQPGELTWLTGVHRFQHEPAHLRHKSRQTSYVTVVALGQQQAGLLVFTRDHPDIDVQVRRGHGKGGQHRNSTESSCTVVHKPTRLSATRDSGRSQPANVAEALAELAGKVAAYEAAKADAALQADRRGQQEGPLAFTHSAFESWGVKEHATGRTWQARAWAQGKFTPSKAA